MTSEKLNVEQISLKTKEYFEKVRGMKAYFFNVSECKIIPCEPRWKVVCSFISNPFEGIELEYDVIVENNGEVSRVSRRINKID